MCAAWPPPSRMLGAVVVWPQLPPPKTPSPMLPVTAPPPHPRPPSVVSFPADTVGQVDGGPVGPWGATGPDLGPRSPKPGERPLSPGRRLSWRAQCTVNSTRRHRLPRVALPQPRSLPFTNPSTHGSARGDVPMLVAGLRMASSMPQMWSRRRPSP